MSFADAPTFDRELIADVYDYLIAADDSLRERFTAEKQDALA